ncbi:MAG: glutaminyl-peptide cyclotransferase [Acetobacteraceae bacterium]|nr:glutaminyl-peptide cyclotransferase [Acetobacteraceae bacterium]
MRRRHLGALMASPLLAGAAPHATQAPAPPDETPHVQVTRARVLDQRATPVFGYRILRTYPHDVESYTEGLVHHEGVIYEGTGLYGRSRLRAWDLETGRTLRETSIDRRYFGEGVTLLDGRLYQLTYLANTGWVYDATTFRREREFRYPSQGWGLTTDGSALIMSDGSSAIQFLDPATMLPRRFIYVTDAVGPVGFLNELEHAEGRLYANVWQTDFIAMIDPSDGRITGWIDLTGLNPDPARLVYPLVLNGIAYRRAAGTLLVTGKCWPHVWEIALVPRQAG